MTQAQLVITAVVVEGRSKSEVAREYEVSRRWVQQLVARYQAEGQAAYQPRSRRPRSNPHRTAAAVEEAIIEQRKKLLDAGWDAGADTIHTHLVNSGMVGVPSVPTIWRILRRRGFVTPQPHKRPKSCWKRFEADQPNECWQADITHWPLSDGIEAEIFNVIDDHSRLLVGSTARTVFKAADVVIDFDAAISVYGPPQRLLTDVEDDPAGPTRGGV
jgi:transposase